MYTVKSSKIFLFQTIQLSQTFQFQINQCSPMARETWVQSQVELYLRLKQWYLIPPCLKVSIIRYGSSVKCSYPGKRVAPSPIHWCSSYRKGILRVTLDNDYQLYFLLFCPYTVKCQNSSISNNFVLRKYAV